MHKTVFIDLETTGLDTNTARPIQIAMVAVDRDTLEQIDSMEIKIEFDEALASPDALERNHYDRDVWAAEALPTTLAIKHVGDFLKRHATWQRTGKSGRTYTTCEIAGHNIAGYDAPILQRWFGDKNLFCPAATWTTGPVDTMHMARCIDWLKGYDPDPDGYSLGALCARYFIKIENEHDALDDVTATVKMAKALRLSVVK